MAHQKIMTQHSYQLLKPKQLFSSLVLSLVLQSITATPPPPNLRIPSDLTHDALSDLVTNLPGLNTLPSFKMFSGYLPINTTTTSYIHYWFVEAETAPETAPVVWWSNGGPGCSGLIGFGTEHGPFHFHGDGTLTPNEYSWNKFANMLYVSQPVGVGFSYTDEKAGTITDSRAAEDNYRTILSFFRKFPNLKGNEFYVSSESYGGHYVPQLTKTILEEDTAHEINFRGFAVGNPYVDPFSNDVGMLNAFYYHGLVPKPLFDKYNEKCTTPENYDANTFRCQIWEARMERSPGNKINPYALDYPVCLEGDDSAKGTVPAGIYQRLQLAKYTSSKAQLGGSVPVVDAYEPCVLDHFTEYLNRADVQKALHVRPGNWAMCAGRGFRYDYDDVDTSQIDLYKSLVTDIGVKANLNMLVFSGDDDAICSLEGTQYWIYDLGVDVNADVYWQEWEVDGQTAGYVTKFELEGGSFTLVTVRSAGHEVPTYKPRQALELFRKFLSGEW